MLQKCLIACIYLYRYVFSSFCSNACRFYPSCSSYAEIALRRFGCIQGGWLVIKRLSRCHPWHPGGYDSVPEQHACNGCGTERSEFSKGISK